MNPKAIARRALGPLYGPLQRTWSALRTRIRSAAARRRARRVWRALTAGGVHVSDGPFAGMRCLPEAVEGSLYPKLAGTYESELHPILEDIAATPYDHVINIGAADGYYAAGLALRLPGAVVDAYDIDGPAREASRATAELNGVSARVRVHGGFDPGFVEPGLRVLVVCDCEGCELDALDPARGPWLAAADILVELHDFIDRRVSPSMVQRFGETHEILVIDSQPHDPDGVPALRRLSRRERMLAVDERRPVPMQWMWMRSTAHKGRSSSH